MQLFKYFKKLLDNIKYLCESVYPVENGFSGFFIFSRSFWRKLFLT
jgi:hypothetical protein